MRANDGRLIYVAVGPLTAILLGGTLIPFREALFAPTLLIPFVILTIVVAEFGGNAAALTGALVSTLSLDFFLTKPYLSLALTGKHDVATFLELLACGLVAAALGARRAKPVS